MSILHREKEDTVEIKLSKKVLSAQQIRLIRSLNVALQSLMSTTDERTLFVESLELIRLAGASIKQSNFGQKKIGKTTYGDQALELAVDELYELLKSKQVAQFDH